MMLNKNGYIGESDFLSGNNYYMCITNLIKVNAGSYINNLKFNLELSEAI